MGKRASTGRADDTSAARKSSSSSSTASTTIPSRPSLAASTSRSPWQSSSSAPPSSFAPSPLTSPSSSTTAPSPPLSVNQGRAPRRRKLPPKLREAEDKGEAQGKVRKRARVSVGGNGGGANVKGRAKKIESSAAGGPCGGGGNGGVSYGGGAGSEQQQQQQHLGQVKPWRIPGTHAHTQTPTVDQDVHSPSLCASTYTPPCSTRTFAHTGSFSGSGVGGSGGGGGGGGGPSGIPQRHTGGLPSTAISHHTPISMCIGAEVEVGRKTGGACAGVEVAVATADSVADGSMEQQQQGEAGTIKQEGEGDATSSLRKQLQDALHDNTRLHTALTDALSRRHTLTQALTHTRAQCDTLQQTLLSRQREKEGVEAALAEAKKIVVVKDDEGLSREGKKALLESRRALTGVQKSLCDTPDALKDAQGALRESEREACRLKALAEENQKGSSESVTDHATCQTRVDAYQGQLEECRKEVGEVKGNLRRTQEALSSALRVCEERGRENEELVKRVKELERQTAGLQAGLEAAKKDAQANKDVEDAHNLTVRALEDELRAVRSANLSSQMSLTEANNKSQVALAKVTQVKDENSVLEASVRNLKQRESSLQAQLLQVQVLEDELRAVRSANLSSQMSLTEANNKAQAALAKVIQVEDAKSVLEASVRELKQREPSLQAQLLQLKIRLSEVKSEKRDGWARDLELIESLNKRLRDASSREASLQKQLHDMRSVLRDTTSKITSRTAAAAAVAAVAAV